MATSSVRTTLTLPAELIAAADQLVRAGKARNRNEIVTQALRAELQQRRHQDLDAQFAAMATDKDYQLEALQLVEEFGSSDHETWAAIDSGQERVP